MIGEYASLTTFILQGIIAFLLVILLFYAVSILATFRKGMLERGWKYLSVGLIILVGGDVVLTLSNYYTSGGVLYELGLAIDAAGVVFAILGFKSHRDIWASGNKEEEAKSREQAQTPQNSR